MTPSEQRPRRIWIRLRRWSRRVGLGRKLAYGLAAASVASGVATVVTMTKSSPLNIDLNLLYLDAVLLLLLGMVVARRLVAVWVERRRGLAGSRLHIRLVALFGLVAVTPAIIVAVFAGLFLNYGIEAWFSERVRTAIQASSAVAKSYLHEHQQNIRADALAMANDLDRAAPILMRNPQRFDEFLNAQVAIRSLAEALVIDGQGRVLGRSQFSTSLEFDLVPPGALQQARENNVVVLTNERDDRVRAILKLDQFYDAYLLVGRFVEPSVLDYIDKTQKAVEQYQTLEKQRRGIQVTFVVIFTVVAVLLLLAAVWLGLILSTQLVRPVSNLISAAERVRKGDLSARVHAPSTSDEMGTLSRAFNRMADRLEEQQRGLMEANRELDERRRFTETVLTGVTSGVIGLDAEGRVNLPNRSASELLSINLEAAVDQPLSVVVPEMTNLLADVMTMPDRMREAQIRLSQGDRTRTLLVRIGAERLGGEVVGYVVTFDDITDLLVAQRKAAWADVARRIAHEIKNPLTPIQLSAERLKRKYLKQIAEDPDTFVACTNTIVRQVGDIGRMVDEFSSFARMPQPSIRPGDLSEVCRQTIFLERNRTQDIEFRIEAPDSVKLSFDERLIGQALTNLLKNATESIDARQQRDKNNGDTVPPGVIVLGIDEMAGSKGTRVVVHVDDNGLGLPRKNRDSLTEPYVTTREKGTGLGLAIVKKIMEEHNGDLVLEDRDEGGARVSLVFPPVDRSAAEAPAENTKIEATDVLTHGS